MSKEITSKTTLYYFDGQGRHKQTRVLGRAFNQLLRRARKGTPMLICDEDVAEIKISSHTWEKVAAAVRKGESVTV